MAGELQTDWLANKTVYFLVRSATGSIWNGTSFESYSTANYASYALAATAQGTASGYYIGNLPALPAGLYTITAKQQLGGSPLETDSTIGTGLLTWNGTSVTSLDPLTSSVPGNYGSGTAGGVLGRLATGTILTTSIVAPGGNFTVYRGDTYYAVDDRALSWTGPASTWPDLTGSTVTLYLYGAGWSRPMSLITTGPGSQQVQLELSSSDTLSMPLGNRAFSIKATLSNGHVATIVSAQASILAS